MPIRINLLSEALAEEDLRRRDPVKRSIYIGAFLVALSLVWFSSTWLEYKLTQSNYSKVEIEIQTHTNEFFQVKGGLNRIADSQNRLNALSMLSTNRFLQGNLLNALQQVYVPNIQLLRIKVDQSYPGKSTEQITLSLDGKDSSPNLDQMNRYKEELAKLDYFKSNLDPTNAVKLSRLSSPQPSIYGGRPFVLFTLDCRFADKTR
jgi:hypothetical protein